VAFRRCGVMRRAGPGGDPRGPFLPATVSSSTEPKRVASEARQIVKGTAFARKCGGRPLDEAREVEEVGRLTS